MDNQSLSQALLSVYRKLMTRYGPLYWWPAEEAFEIMAGAILTQSAAWLNVEKAIANLKVAGALSPEAQRHLSLSEIAALIYSSGNITPKR